MKRTLLVGSVLAEDQPQVKLKSLSTARVLSFLPVNSPAIFYVKKPVRGAVYSALEAGGLTSVGFGAYFLTQVGKEPRAFLSDLSDTLVKGVGVTLVVIGAVAWMPPWIHTVVATPDYVDDCNAVSFYPLIKENDGNSLYGMGLRYKF